MSDHPLCVYVYPLPGPPIRVIWTDSNLSQEILTGGMWINVTLCDQLKADTLLEAIRYWHKSWRDCFTVQDYLVKMGFHLKEAMINAPVRLPTEFP